MLSSNLHLFEEVKNSPNLEEALKEKFKYSDEIIAEIVENYPAATKSESLKLFRLPNVYYHLNSDLWAK